jgi:hypothetical protein
MKAAAGKIAKAVVGGALAGLTTLGAYLVNDTAISDVTAGQWVYGAIAALGTGAAVFGIRNAQ